MKSIVGTLALLSLLTAAPALTATRAGPQAERTITEARSVVTAVPTPHSATWHPCGFYQRTYHSANYWFYNNCGSTRKKVEVKHLTYIDIDCIWPGENTPVDPAMNGDRVRVIGTC